METKEFKENLPKQNYEINFSNGDSLIICDKSYNQILEQLDDNQDIMLFTENNRMINLNQIVSISQLDDEKDIEVAQSEPKEDEDDRL